MGIGYNNPFSGTDHLRRNCIRNESCFILSDLAGYERCHDVPAILFDPAQWNVENFVNYDKTPFMSALIQLALHRSVAYILIIIILAYFVKAIRIETSKPFKTGLYLLISMLIIQVLLGIFTLINSVGTIPVGLGVLHQGGALLLLTICLFLNYQTSENKI